MSATAEDEKAARSEEHTLVRASRLVETDEARGEETTTPEAARTTAARAREERGGISGTGVC
ncbi:hypothetical protein ABZP36_014319 [Zizania latifolia]